MPFQDVAWNPALPGEALKAGRAPCSAYHGAARKGIRREVRSMRQYEVMYIMDPMLEEDQQNALVERFQTLVQTQGAEVQHLDRWERRRLAYEVKGRREGYYVV